VHEYDVALKVLLRGSAQGAFRMLTGISVERWIDIELPKVQNPRVDLLGESADGALIHLELQSGNDAEMPLRMAEYALGVYRLFGKFPRQLVLYVGERVLRMSPTLSGPRFSFSYELIDLRDMDGEPLLASEQVGDNVIAILTCLRDRRSAIHEIVCKIAGLEGSQRESALRQLVILSGLRGLEEVIEGEIKNMPILNDIMDHKVLGREFKRGLDEGLQQGLQHGLQQGLQQGELKLVRKQIEERFGAIPAWADQRLSSYSAAELETLGVRLLHVNTLEELLTLQ
jgi:predicted transposase YdaD